MKDNKLRGIILRKTNYAENDIIFDVLSESGEVVGFFGRGAKKMKSRFAGVLQLGQVVHITFGKGKNLNYPTEVTIDSKYLFSFYSRSLKHMNFYLDILVISRAVSKDLNQPELFDEIIEAFAKAEKNEDLNEVYGHFLKTILELIGVEVDLRCFFSNQIIHEKEFYYIPQSNKVFGKDNKPKTIDAELITSDAIFEKNYLQKLIYQHVNHKLNLKF